MVHVIALGVVIAGSVFLGQRWRAERRADREVRRCERLAAVVVHEEIKAAINALDLALRDEDFKWLVSMSQSRTLTEAWREHGEALVWLGTERWGIISDAVSAVAPGYGLISGGGHSEDVRRALVERRALLVEGAGVLRAVNDRRRRGRPAKPDSVRSLLA